ncbi:MAG: response regulator [Pseudomonadota bacterium]|nr:response regulator [Pseudomonadota bacterium]
MARLLIADESKAGLVMSTEVFKEKIPGITVSVAKTGKDFLRMLNESPPDVAVVDFDLPDVDGTTLLRHAQSITTVPIILTAYLDSRIREVIRDELLTFNDSDIFLEKPVKFDKLASIIDKFLVAKKRILKRLKVCGEVVCKGLNGSFESKAKLINMSLGGVCVCLNKAIAPRHVGEQVAVSLSIGDGRRAEMQGMLRWVDGKTVGIHFKQLTDAQRQFLEHSLRVVSTASTS